MAEEFLSLSEPVAHRSSSDELLFRDGLGAAQFQVRLDGRSQLTATCVLAGEGPELGYGKVSRASEVGEEHGKEAHVCVCDGR